MKTKKQTKRDAKKLFRLCIVNGLPDEDRVRKVAQHVATVGYRDCPAILAHFLQLVTYDQFQRTAMVESAAPLPVSLTPVQTSAGSR